MKYNLYTAAYIWFYYRNNIKMHGHMKVKYIKFMSVRLFFFAV